MSSTVLSVDVDRAAFAVPADGPHLPCQLGQLSLMIGVTGRTWQARTARPHHGMAWRQFLSNRVLGSCGSGSSLGLDLV